MSPAHWLAENFEREAPTPILPPKAIAAATGSHALATSAPYFMADSVALNASPYMLFVKLTTPLLHPDIW